MSKHRKTDGTTTVKGPDGRISGNIAADAAAGPQPAVSLAVRAPWGVDRYDYATVDEALAAYDEAILRGHVVVDWSDQLGKQPTTTPTPVNPGVLADYPGRVLAWRENNHYDDSDFHALVEETPGQFRWVTYASTAYGPGGYVPALDATDDVLARYEVAQRERAVEVADRRALLEFQTCPPVGTSVTVVEGRKYKGRSGVVARVAVDKFKSGRYGDYYRTLVTDAAGDEFWVDASYLEGQHRGQVVRIEGYRSRNSRSGEIDALLSFPEFETVRAGVMAARR